MGFVQQRNLQKGVRNRSPSRIVTKGHKFVFRWLPLQGNLGLFHEPKGNPNGDSGFTGSV